MSAKADLLRAALDVVEKRGLVYGQAENNFGRIAALWTDFLTMRVLAGGQDRSKITETDVAIMMDLMKTARLMEKPDHYDSWLDKAGYSACGAEVSGAAAPPAFVPPIDKVEVVRRHGVYAPGDVIEVPKGFMP